MLQSTSGYKLRAKASFFPIRQPRTTSSPRPVARTRRARARMRQFAEAEQLAAEVLRASRTDTAAVSILAQALQAQNRGGEAIAPLEKAARRGSDAGMASKPCLARRWAAPDAEPKRLNNCAGPRRGVRHLRRPSRNSPASLPRPDASMRPSPSSKAVLHWRLKPLICNWTLRACTYSMKSAARCARSF